MEDLPARRVPEEVVRSGLQVQLPPDPLEDPVEVIEDPFRPVPVGLGGGPPDLHLLQHPGHLQQDEAVQEVAGGRVPEELVGVPQVGRQPVQRLVETPPPGVGVHDEVELQLHPVGHPGQVVAPVLRVVLLRIAGREDQHAVLLRRLHPCVTVVVAVPASAGDHHHHGGAAVEVLGPVVVDGDAPLGMLPAARHDEAARAGPDLDGPGLDRVRYRLGEDVPPWARGEEDGLGEHHGGASVSVHRMVRESESGSERTWRVRGYSTERWRPGRRRPGLRRARRRRRASRAPDPGAAPAPTVTLRPGRSLRAGTSRSPRRRAGRSPAGSPGFPPPGGPPP